MKSALGRGLQSLIPRKKTKQAKPSIKINKENWSKDKKKSIFNIEIDKIRPNPHQPRQELDKESLRELAGSIREHGILQPLIVTKIEKPTSRGRDVEYELVAGERRWRAAKMAGLPSVPVIIRDSSAYEKLGIALVENIQRKNLSVFETALAYKQLNERFKLKHREIAKKVGKSRSAVTNVLRLLSLPLRIQEAMSLGEIEEGHGRAILLAKPEARMAVFRKVIDNKLSVRRAEDLARRAADELKPKAKGPKNPLFRKIEKDLKQIWGRRVSITKRGEVGTVSIEFSDDEELDKLVNHFSKI